MYPPFQGGIKGGFVEDRLSVPPPALPSSVGYPCLHNFRTDKGVCSTYLSRIHSKSVDDNSFHSFSLRYADWILVCERTPQEF